MAKSKRYAVLFLVISLLGLFLVIGIPGIVGTGFVQVATKEIPNVNFQSTDGKIYQYKLTFPKDKVPSFTVITSSSASKNLKTSIDFGELRLVNALRLQYTGKTVKDSTKKKIYKVLYPVMETSDSAYALLGNKFDLLKIVDPKKFRLNQALDYKNTDVIVSNLKALNAADCYATLPRNYEIAKTCDLEFGLPYVLDYFREAGKNEVELIVSSRDDPRWKALKVYNETLEVPIGYKVLAAGRAAKKAEKKYLQGEANIASFSRATATQTNSTVTVAIGILKPVIIKDCKTCKCGCDAKKEGCKPETDFDNDKTPNCIDLCPNDANKIAPLICGCGLSDTKDSDADGTIDCKDECPNNRKKIKSDSCGCFNPTDDQDGDGTKDCSDKCPNDREKTIPGICGCNSKETDSDNDGTPDCIDQCPANPSKTQPGSCGCYSDDADSDGDGVNDCEDGCPNDYSKSSPGSCGCNKDDSDPDADGLPSCSDPCPNNPIADLNAPPCSCNATKAPNSTTTCCGNAIIDANSEQCDDGNATSNDGCDSSCKTEATPIPTAEPTPVPPTEDPCPCKTPPSGITTCNLAKKASLFTTYYYTANWRDYSIDKDVTISILDGTTGSTGRYSVSSEFRRALLMEGSGWLNVTDSEGKEVQKTVNYWDEDSFHFTAHLYGHASSPNVPLVPYQSLANGGKYPKGTWLCIQSTLGKTIPTEYGGQAHSGWWQVVDAGDDIADGDLDMFIGVGFSGLAAAQGLFGADNIRRDVYRGQ